MRPTLILLLSLLLGPLAWPASAPAKAAESVKAPRGGELRKLGGLRFELITEGPFVAVYLYDEHLQPLKAAPVIVHVKIVAGKAEPRPAALKVEQYFWEFKLEPTELARATVEFYVDHQGKREKLRWNIGAKTSKGKKG